MIIQKEKIFKVRDKYVSCNFEIKSGINVLFGPNGIGKSTFFHYIKNNRKDITGNNSCAFMDQFPLTPLSELTGEDVLLILKKDLGDCNSEKVDYLVNKFKFGKLLNSKVENYSGGENQVFKFIILMGQRADIYFLDEPLQYLDNDNVEKLLEVLETLNDKRILIVEHRKEKIEPRNYNNVYMKNTNELIEITHD